MPRTLIVGYGSPLRGDDAVGWRAAERLAESVGPGEGLEVATLHQLTPEVAADLSRFERAIFIDAAVEGAPGAMSIRQLEPAPWLGRPFTHHLPPEALLGCARDLYGACPQAYLITVVGARFEPSEELSPRVQAALDEIVRTALELTQNSRFTGEPPSLTGA